MNHELAKAEDKLYEIFVHSDDTLVKEDLVTDLLNFEYGLRDALYNLVIMSAGTKKLASTATLNKQIEKTIKKYALYQLEQQ